jgi:hypothetical protein
MAGDALVRIAESGRARAALLRLGIRRIVASGKREVESWGFEAALGCKRAFPDELRHAPIALLQRLGLLQLRRPTHQPRQLAEARLGEGARASRGGSPRG